MTDDQQSLMDTFNRFIEGLARDAAALREAALDTKVPREARRILVGSLDYLPRQFDIIPDHFAEIGALDDAFVLRIGAMLAVKAGLGEIDLDSDLELQRLASDVPLIRSFLADAYPLLVAYVVRLPDLHVRGRDADRVLDDADARDQFLRELRRDLASADRGVLTNPASLDTVRRLIREKCTRSLPGAV
jgi:uncharacterized membrane protein YkvA (DUF1232 family)